MSENPTKPPEETLNPPPKTNPLQTGPNGKPQKHPAQNGGGQSSSRWDFVETPDLDKEDSKDKN